MCPVGAFCRRFVPGRRGGQRSNSDDVEVMSTSVRGWCAGPAGFSSVGSAGVSSGGSARRRPRARAACGIVSVEAWLRSAPAGAGRRLGRPARSATRRRLRVVGLGLVPGPGSWAVDAAAGTPAAGASTAGASRSKSDPSDGDVDVRDRAWRHAAPRSQARGRHGLGRSGRRLRGRRLSRRDDGRRGLHVEQRAEAGDVDVGGRGRRRGRLGGGDGLGLDLLVSRRLGNLRLGRGRCLGRRRCLGDRRAHRLGSHGRSSCRCGRSDVEQRPGRSEVLGGRGLGPRRLRLGDGGRRRRCGRRGRCGRRVQVEERPARTEVSSGLRVYRRLSGRRARRGLQVEERATG